MSVLLLTQLATGGLGTPGRAETEVDSSPAEVSCRSDVLECFNGVRGNTGGNSSVAKAIVDDEDDFVGVWKGCCLNAALAVPLDSSVDADAENDAVRSLQSPLLPPPSCCPLSPLLSLSSSVVVVASISRSTTLNETECLLLIPNGVVGADLLMLE